MPFETPRRRLWLQIGLGFAGLLGISFIAHRAGGAMLWTTLRSVAGWLPLIIILEGARVVADTATSHLLYVKLGSRVPLGPHLRAQLAAYPATLLMPAGRTFGEGVKIALLSQHISPERAAAASVFSQAFSLLGGFVITLPTVFVAYSIHAPVPLTTAFVVQGLAAIGGGAGLLWVARRRGVGRLVGKLSTRLGAAADETQQHIDSLGYLPLQPFFATLANRMLLAAQIIVMAHVVGVPGGLGGGMMALGAFLVGAAAGDVIPGQLGATDSLLALAADAMQTPLASAVSIAIVIHATQMLWAAAGSVITLAARRSGK